MANALPDPGDPVEWRPPSLPTQPTIEQFRAAREIIRDYSESQQAPIGIYLLLSELGEERFPTSPDMYRLLSLITHLQADPNIRQETSDLYPIEFEWSEEQRIHCLFGLAGEPW